MPFRALVSRLDPASRDRRLPLEGGLGAVAAQANADQHGPYLVEMLVVVIRAHGRGLALERVVIILRDSAVASDFRVRHSRIVVLIGRAVQMHDEYERYRESRYVLDVLSVRMSEIPKLRIVRYWKRSGPPSRVTVVVRCRSAGFGVVGWVGHAREDNGGFSG